MKKKIYRIYTFLKTNKSNIAIEKKMEYIVCFHTKFSTASIQFRRLDYSLDNFTCALSVLKSNQLTTFKP